MTSIDESNVDQFKTEHECDEHWELRRKFLLAHGDKFPKDELMCLAQVFTNIEFLGCRYPSETMKIIAELSKDVVKDYREKQKNRLQRTFVKASDAASSRAKGQSKQEKSTNQSNTGESSRNRYHQPLSSSFKRKQEPEVSSYSNPEVKRRKPIKQIKEDDVVLFEHTQDTAQNIIARAASTYDIDLDWKYDVVNEDILCSVFFNKHKVAAAKGPNQKAAKKDAAEAALKEMQKFYYTVKVTKNLTPTVTDNLAATKDSKDNSNVIGNDNVGMKMMKLMGWSGGGLGKTSQGITEPVNVQQQMTREGLGLKPGLFNKQAFKKKCTEVLQNFIRGNMTTDLVFNPSFSNEERAMIHQIAQQLGLKSQSYGPKTQRTLTISRKINPFKLVNELLEAGGSTEKYQLIEPTGKK